MKEPLNKLTIKELFSKIVNFNLYTLKDYFYKFRFYLLYFLSGVLITYFLFLGGYWIKSDYDQSVLEDNRDHALTDAKLTYKYDKQCRLSAKMQAEQDGLTLDNFQYHINYLQCYEKLQNKALSEHDINVLKIVWDDPYTRANLMRSGYFFKWNRPHTVPTSCKLESNFFRCK
jgi:hypothetical protein